MSFQILTINPGSTSTKIAIFEDEKEIFSKTLRHTAEELSPYATVASQFQFRKNKMCIRDRTGISPFWV